MVVVSSQRSSIAQRPGCPWRSLPTGGRAVTGGERSMVIWSYEAEQCTSPRKLSIQLRAMSGLFSRRANASPGLR